MFIAGRYGPSAKPQRGDMCHSSESLTQRRGQIAPTYWLNHSEAAFEGIYEHPTVT